jgi:hypothetical protein
MDFFHIGTLRTSDCSKAALLSSEHFLNVTDFALDLSAGLFGCPTIAQVSISADLARLFFHFPFGFVDSASDLIFRARFHERESQFMNATDVDFEPASAPAITTGSERLLVVFDQKDATPLCGRRDGPRDQRLGIANILSRWSLGKEK